MNGFGSRFGVSIPLVFYGAFRGYRMPAIEVPTATSQTRKRVSQSGQHWSSHPLFVYGIGGSLPFAAVFTELYFLMSSVWQHHAYHLFGFLALVLIILVFTCAETAVAFTYFQLTTEDPEWWWRSFGVSGAGAFYMFAYSVAYFYTRLQMTKFASVVLYFGYMSFASVSFALMTGSIGLISSFLFVRVIYGAVKID
jgi:transmembrane 9 superfamily protein 2/4